MLCTVCLMVLLSYFFYLLSSHLSFVCLYVTHKSSSFPPIALYFIQRNAHFRLLFLLLFYLLFDENKNQYIYFIHSTIMLHTPVHALVIIFNVTRKKINNCSKGDFFFLIIYCRIAVGWKNLIIGALADVRSRFIDHHTLINICNKGNQFIQEEMKSSREFVDRAKKYLHKMAWPIINNEISIKASHNMRFFISKLLTLAWVNVSQF